jgi:hypothetical protein
MKQNAFIYILWAIQVNWKKKKKTLTPINLYVVVTFRP